MSVKQTSGFDLFLSYTKILLNNDLILKIEPSVGWSLVIKTAFGTALIRQPYIDNLFSKAQNAARQKNPQSRYTIWASMNLRSYIILLCKSHVWRSKSSFLELAKSSGG